MIKIHPPSIKIIEFGEGRDQRFILVKSKSTNTLNPETKLTTLLHLNTSSEIDLKLDGFDFFEISNSGYKLLCGKIYVRQIIDGLEVLTLICSPKYLFVDLGSKQQEQQLVREIKRLINQQWANCFSESLNYALMPLDKHQVKTGARVLDLTRKIKNQFSFIFANKKSLFYLTIILLTITANAAIWKMDDGNKNEHKATQYNMKTAEQMAVEQDQILNNAFREIGIDREKLASDMSCFTE